MTLRVHSDVLDKGLAEIKNYVDKILLIDAYATDDSYATVTTSGNILAEVATTSSDFTLANDTGGARKVTSPSGKVDSSANNSGLAASNHIAFIDTVNSRVLWVTTETSGQNIVATNGITFPALVLTFKQPVLPA